MTTWVLLDRTEFLLRRLYRCLPAHDPTLLLETTELHSHAHHGPVWLGATASAEIIMAMRSAPKQWPGLIIESQHTAAEVLAHLRFILFVQFGAGQRAVLRYSHPVTASYFFTVDDVSTINAWLGPIARISWYGGTWQDLAEGTERWLSAGSTAASTWQAHTSQQTPAVGGLHMEALERQQKHHFVYRWWRKQSGLSFRDVLDLVDQGMAEGLRTLEELDPYLTRNAITARSQ